MKIEPYVEKKDVVAVVNVNMEQKVEIRQLEGGGIKKTIKPKIVQTF
jgi:hypothetical protein